MSFWSKFDEAFGITKFCAYLGIKIGNAPEPTENQKKVAKHIEKVTTWEFAIPRPQFDRHINTVSVNENLSVAKTSYDRIRKVLTVGTKFDNATIKKYHLATDSARDNFLHSRIAQAIANTIAEDKEGAIDYIEYYRASGKFRKLQDYFAEVFAFRNVKNYVPKYISPEDLERFKDKEHGNDILGEYVARRFGFLKEYKKRFPERFKTLGND